jgi:chromosomal replication initiator protein
LLKKKAKKKVVTKAQRKATMLCVARCYGLSVAELKSDSRIQEIAWARQVAMYVLRKKLELPLQTIGKLLGGRDHSTILHGVRRVHVELQRNASIKQEVAGLLRRRA